MSFAIRHAPRKPAGDQPAMPAGPWPADGDAPADAGLVDADLVNLLHGTDLPAVNLSCEMEHWTDVAVPPAALADSPGLSSVLRALAERAGQQGVTYRRARLRAVVPVSYRLDSLTGKWRGNYLSIACDGEQTTKLIGDRVVTSRATPPSQQLRAMLSPAWLLKGWRLRPAGDVDVGGRTGIRLLACKHGESGALPDRLEAVVDTAAGFLLRYTTYRGDEPADCTELRDVRLVDGTVPGEFKIEPGPGMRAETGTGTPLDFVDPQVRQRAKHAAKGAMAAGAAVSGWLDRQRGRQDRD